MSTTSTQHRKTRTPARKHGTPPAAPVPAAKPPGYEERWFIGCDLSGHHYLVPVSLRAAWNLWQESDEDDEASWTPPAGARRIDGPHLLTFTDPREETTQ